ncbi:helix-turn-helix domain-containing protein [Natrialbaceae archaeon AArc-T1-2]|uniref:helix-turn-helix domain-containing protein n=1 Tax=Natrialbaceae archaeon AArc-T1-2 TaxID=3053904 RepID=UPI00255A964A|nr:helix-turn-helix domain-containing protein [Natrialbaceae archaeon AArc-T1-2]WIV67731.1 helix-turn-helix domain-containing protein [Natrialbaceae archaeon AArc-T1-2]
MVSGIRATVTVRNPAHCRLARVATATGETVGRISRSTALPGPTGTVTEFLATEVPDDVDATPVCPYGTATLYRLSHDGDPDCPCECLGQFGCPIDRYVAEDGGVTLVFHVADFEQLQTVMGELRDRFSDVDVTRLLQAPADERSDAGVFVDRDQLTDRQLEVVRTAYEHGYFERPRRTNATELAEELEITRSTVTEHLRTAQRKLLKDVFEDSR